MIGNNSCGTHSLLAGKTADNIQELKILLYDGTQLTVGATEAQELDAIIAAGGRRGEIYGALRGIRDRYADLIRSKYPDIPRRVSGYNLDQLLPENGFNVARALVGTEGTCVAVLEAKARLIPSPQYRSLVGLGYRDAFAAADHVAVAPDRLGPYLRELRQLLDSYNYQAAYYGHFGHGCIHMQVSFDLFTEQGIRNYAEFIERAADLVVKYGGSLSGEHGDGQARGALLPKMFGPKLMQAFRDFKAVWDPQNKMNPHKAAVDPYAPTENLRLGADDKPQDPTTRLAVPDAHGSFAQRC